MDRGARMENAEIENVTAFSLPAGTSYTTGKNAWWKGCSGHDPVDEVAVERGWLRPVVQADALAEGLNHGDGVWPVGLWATRSSTRREF